MATTTPNYGWSVPTSTDYVAQGAVAIETLGDSVDATLFTALGGAYPGLRLVKKQTIGNAVSSVTVSDAFNSTYDNYKIMIADGVGSATDFMTLRLGSTATGYYSSLNALIYASNTGFAQSTNNGAAFGQIGWTNPNFLSMDVNLLNPFLSKWTLMNGGFAGSSVAGSQDGVQSSATSFTAFTLTPLQGTLTGGTIYVYGYGKS